jgi:membrane protease YdiL (CAAX protease family)
LPDRDLRTWLAVLPAMLVPFLASLFYFVLFSEYRFARLIYAATKVFTLVWPLIAMRFILGDRLPALDLRDARHQRAIPSGALLGVVIVLLMFGLMPTPLGEMVNASAPSILKKTRELGVLEHFWLFVLFLSLAHSLIEEYYWRWFVFGRLREIVSPVSAHFLAGAAFAAHHVVVATQFFPLGWGIVLGGLVGVGGVLWSVLYSRQGTLAGAWISHLIVDVGVMGIGYKLLCAASHV